MASFDPQEFGFEEPPPRPTTPPVRRGFLLVLFVLSVAALIVYGVPYVAERTGYAWEAGRSRAASEALAKLEDAGDRSPGLRIVSHGNDGRVARGRERSIVQRAAGRRRNSRTAAGRQTGWGSAFRSAELGSGVIIDKEKGYIVTNNHVIKDADQILVRLGPGDDVPARLVGADPEVRPGRPPGQGGPEGAGGVGRFGQARQRRLGAGHRQPAGLRSFGDRGNRLGDRTERCADQRVRIVHPDRCRDQPGEFGRALIDLAGKVVGINTAIIVKVGIL